MKTHKTILMLILSLCCAGLNAAAQTSSHRAPTLGTDMSFADGPHVLIDAWQNQEKGEALTSAFKSAGVKTMRFLPGGLYSPRGPEATAAIKAENKLKNEYPWFPLESYIDYVATNDFTTVVGVNVEEGPDVAKEMVEKFIKRGLESKIVAIELS